MSEQEEPQVNLQRKETFAQGKIDNRERKRLQHEFKIYTEKFLKESIGRGSNYTKVTLWEKMLIIQGQMFLTEPEKYIAQTLEGSDFINASRLYFARKAMSDNVRYFEEKVGAKCIQHCFDVDSEHDYWMHFMLFDQVLIEQTE